MSQELGLGYAIGAALAAESVGPQSGPPVATGTADALSPHARRLGPAPAPRGRDPIRPEAFRGASRGVRPAHRPRSTQQDETRYGSGADMLQGEPDLEDTKARMAEAADALRRLSMHGLKPSGLRSQWPDIVHRVEEAYGWTGERMRPARPTPAQITRMDEAIGWLLWLDEDERKVVWARAMGLSWRRIEDMDGRSTRTLQTLFAAALRRILARRRTGA